MVSFIVTFLTSLFYIVLAEALYKESKKAYIIGALLHAFAAVSSLTLLVLGVRTVKVLGIFFLVLNVLKFAYLYRARALGTGEVQLETLGD
jgi:predicted permease